MFFIGAVKYFNIMEKRKRISSNLFTTYSHGISQLPGQGPHKHQDSFQLLPRWFSENFMIKYFSMVFLEDKYLAKSRVLADMKMSRNGSKNLDLEMIYARFSEM